MTKSKILKLAALNVGIVLLNVTLFSPGFMNIRMGGQNALSTAIGGTAIFMSFAVFLYGNYKLISQKGKTSTIQIRDIKNKEDCILMLKRSYGKRTFDSDISVILEQVEILGKKKEKIKDILLQKYNIIDKNFERFSNILFDVEYVFYTNVKSILNKINTFDEEEYNRIKITGELRYSEKFIATKKSIYNEYISFVKNSIEDNEEIILRLDALLLEITKLDSLAEGEIDNMTEIKQLDELINKIKYYN